MGVGLVQMGTIFWGFGKWCSDYNALLFQIFKLGRECARIPKKLFFLG